MKGFQISEDYKDFVSTASELLAQFQAGHCEEAVSYQIVPLESGIDLISLLRVIREFLSASLQHYIWHRQAFELNISKDFSCLEGTILLGDGVEDSWYVVYLLLLTTARYPSVAARVTDSDGEFLLIEAADVIPEWMDPDNSSNRVWLYGGNVLVISMDELSGDVNGAIGLQEARKYLSSVISTQGKSRGKYSSLISKEISDIIHSRTLHQFPQRISGLSFSPVAILPSAVARFISANPQAFSNIVHAFHSTRERKENQILMKLPALEKHLQHMVATPVRMTKLLYLLLINKPFHPPKSFHAVLGRLRRGCVALDEKTVTGAVTLGARIVCGLELLISRLGLLSKKFEEAGVNSMLSKCTESEDWLPVNMWQRRSLAEVLQEQLLSAPLDATEVDVDEDAVWSEKKMFQHTGKDFPMGDGDDWSFLSPEDLDAKIQESVRRSQQTQGTAEDLFVDSNLTSTQPVSQLEEVLSGVKSFLAEDADFSRKGLQTEKEIDLKEYFYDSDGDSSDSDDVSDNGRVDQVGSQTPLEKSARIDFPRECFVGTSTYFEDRASRVRVHSERTDSDDEFPGEETDEESDGDEGLSGYEDALVAELSESTLVKSFQLTEGPEQGNSKNDVSLHDVDLDRNLLVNLLESHSLSLGQRGPVGNLLRYLNLHLPPLSPGVTKVDDSELS